MSVYQPSSLTLLLQQEALDRIESVERQITKAVFEKLDSVPVARHDTLTPTELQVLIGTVVGLTTEEMAAKRKVTIKSINTYRDRAREKLGLRSRGDMIRYAMKLAFERGRA